MLYKIGELAKRSGISIRTLRYYEEIELLLPKEILDSGYRLYGENEALRLQQILFYKELGYSLKDIKLILTKEDFNLLNSLQLQKKELLKRQDNLNELIKTLDNTIVKLQNGEVMNIEELYKGFPKGMEYREEAIERWGDKVYQSEKYLMKLKKEDINKLNEEFQELWLNLAKSSELDPKSDYVQSLIEQHFRFIVVYWGADSKNIDMQQYKVLAELYIEDKRFTTIDGVEYPNMGKFLKQAIECFIENRSN